MADAKKTKFTVAKGRTIHHGSERVVKDGVAVGSTEGREYGPGEEVEMTADEARPLIRAGFLGDPEADAPVISTGPKIQVTEEPKR